MAVVSKETADTVIPVAGEFESVDSTKGVIRFGNLSETTSVVQSVTSNPTDVIQDKLIFNLTDGRRYRGVQQSLSITAGSSGTTRGWNNVPSTTAYGSTEGTLTPTNYQSILWTTGAIGLRIFATGTSNAPTRIQLANGTFYNVTVAGGVANGANRTYTFNVPQADLPQDAGGKLSIRIFVGNTAVTGGLVWQEEGRDINDFAAFTGLVSSDLDTPIITPTGNFKTPISKFLTDLGINSIAGLQPVLTWFKSIGGFVTKLSRDLVITTILATPTWEKPDKLPISTPYSVGAKYFDGESQKSGSSQRGNQYAVFNRAGEIGNQITAQFSETDVWFFGGGTVPDYSPVPSAYRQSARSFLEGGRLRFVNATGGTVFSATNFKFWGGVYIGLRTALTQSDSSATNCIGFVGKTAILEYKYDFQGSHGLGVNFRREGSGTTLAIPAHQSPLDRSDQSGEVFHWTTPIGSRAQHQINEEAVFRVPTALVGTQVIAINIDRYDNDNQAGGVASANFSIRDVASGDVGPTQLNFTWSVGGGFASLRATATYDASTRSIVIATTLEDGAINYFVSATYLAPATSIRIPTTYAFEVLHDSAPHGTVYGVNDDINYIQWAIERQNPGSTDNLLSVLVSVDGHTTSKIDTNRTISDMVSAQGLDYGANVASASDGTRLWNAILNTYDSELGMQATDFTYSFPLKDQDLGVLVHASGVASDEWNIHAKKVSINNTAVTGVGELALFSNADQTTTTAGSHTFYYGRTGYIDTDYYTVTGNSGVGTTITFKRAGKHKITREAEADTDYSFRIITRKGTATSFTATTESVHAHPARDGGTSSGSGASGAILERVTTDVIDVAVGDQCQIQYMVGVDRPTFRSGLSKLFINFLD